MAFVILIVEEVEDLIAQLKRRDQGRYRKVVKVLGFLEQDPGHHSLQSHRYESLDHLFGEKVWESYVENRSPSAWRVWWFYGPDEAQITVVLLGPHP